MTALRPGLRRVLIGTVVLTAAAVLWPADSTTRVAAAVDRGALRHADLVLTRTPASPTVKQHPLPAKLPEHLLEKATFDPFIGVTSQADGAASASAPASRPLVGPVYEAPPPPPPMPYRYLGQMLDPAGKRLVYLTRPDKDVSVSVGTRLDEGYVVEAIDDKSVRLLFPPQNVRMVIPIAQTSDSPFAVSGAARP